MSDLPRWLTVAQAAEELGVSESEARSAKSHGRLPCVRTRKIAHGTDRGVVRWDRDSLSWSFIEPLNEGVDVDTDGLPAWLSLQQVADYYQVAPKSVRRWLTAGLLEGRRIGSRGLRVSRESVLQLGKYPSKKYENRL